VELESDPQLLNVKPRHFAEHLEILRRHYKTARLQQFGADQHSSDSSNCGVIITFDDGYADNFYNALPLLQAADCPATVFITSGMIGAAKEFWWDELERVFLTNLDLPPQLSLALQGHDHVWRITAAPDDRNSCRSWNVLLEQQPTSRQAVYLELCRLLRTLDEVERSGAMEELRRWARLESAGRTSHRSLTSDELNALASAKIIEIGAHTVSHPSLASLSKSTQLAEINKSKTMLEDYVGKQIRSFSYPFGAPNNYTADTIRFVREAGYDVACANYPDLAYRNSDRYQLPRFLVRDWDGDQFANHVRSWIEIYG
jgi:peptidoglycan/xylan/chitin deacetylase (PgdA/CDA1 family)